MRCCEEVLILCRRFVVRCKANSWGSCSPLLTEKRNFILLRSSVPTTMRQCFMPVAMVTSSPFSSIAILRGASTCLNSSTNHSTGSVYLLQVSSRHSEGSCPFPTLNFETVHQTELWVHSKTKRLNYRSENVGSLCLVWKLLVKIQTRKCAMYKFDLI